MGSFTSQVGPQPESLSNGAEGNPASCCLGLT